MGDKGQNKCLTVWKEEHGEKTFQGFVLRETLNQRVKQEHNFQQLAKQPEYKSARGI
jgi:hypothetical protein